jgi:hypothetical protein
MGQADLNASNVEPLFDPASHHGSPDDVLKDVRLSTDEKRVILSRWASDMYVVESQPALREVPGIPHRLRLADILAALKQLDDDNDPPPRGGLAMRVAAFEQAGLRCGQRAAAFHRRARRDETASVDASSARSERAVDP